VTDAVCRETPLQIIYADPWIVAINKPSGLFVHRTRLDFEATAFAVQRLRDQLGRPVYPAHRLDRATSGVLLFALDRDVLPALAMSFEAGTVIKHYVAVVRGWPPDYLHIDYPLKRFTAADGDGAPTGSTQPAETMVYRLGTAELPIRVDRYPTTRYALLGLTPRTGRRHQLRRHLRHANHPIIGDTTYGQGRHNRLFREQFQCHRMLLHATHLQLKHPLSGQSLHISAALPEDFSRVIDRLQMSIGTFGQPMDSPLHEV
jgi:tRNA pseudouridine65 synthase